MTFSDMEYSGRKRVTQKEKFLREMNDIIPWAEWVNKILPYYPNGKRGRPPRGIEVMLRMYLLQIWFNLSDEGLEDAIYDSYAMRNFVGINFLEEHPESLYSDNFVADSFERDLTFNAIYYDFKTGDLVDYHGGLHDIREGIMDTMLDSVVALGHDPRIAIRGIRFVSRYGFRFSDRMDVAMRKNGAEYVAANSPEMNRENIAKYYDAGYARRCLDTLEEYGLFCAVYPPVAELYDTEAYRQYICSATDWMDER